MRLRTPFLLLLAASGGLVESAWTHELIFERAMASPFEVRPQVLGLKDVDGDQVPDFAVGTTDDVGSVRIVSGATKQTLFTFQGDAQAPKLGRMLSLIGDVDLDGIDDLVVAFGAFGSPTGVRVFSLGTGQALYTIPYSPFGYESFGSALTGLGDQDGDGRADFAVGAKQFYVAGSIHVLGTGFVRIYSGGAGSMIRQINGPASEMGFGNSIANAGDLDADGKDDILISQSVPFSTGFVRAYSCVSGALIRTYPHPEPFGAVVAALGDVDADGIGDLAIGGSNSVAAISGATGISLYRHTGTDSLSGYGASLTSLGDMDGDGVSDLLVGAPQKYVCIGSCGPIPSQVSIGYASLLSGRTGALLETIVGNASSLQLGSSCAALGDLDGDGKPEFLVATMGDNWTRPAKVRIYDGRAGFSAPQTYCVPYGNAPGPGSIGWVGSTSIGANQLSVTLSGGAPGLTCQLYCGSSATAAQQNLNPPQGFMGMLCVGGQPRPIGMPQLIPASGSVAVTVDLGPASPFTIGTTCYFQFIVNGTSDALAMTFTP